MSTRRKIRAGYWFWIARAGRVAVHRGDDPRRGERERFDLHRRAGSPANRGIREQLGGGSCFGEADRRPAEDGVAVEIRRFQALRVVVD